VEIWKDIPNNENYQCSNLGNFRSKARKVRFLTVNGKEAFRSKSPKKLTPQLNIYRGYTYITLGGDNKKTCHRWLAMTFLEDFDSKLDVDHINGIRTDNRVENLRMCTRKENLNNPITKVYCLTRERDRNGRYM
jgi:hypothetical protein